MGAQLNTLDWTADRVAILVAGWAAGDTSSVIARRLKERTGCDTPSRSAVIGKAFRLKLTRPAEVGLANMHRGGKEKGGRKKVVAEAPFVGLVFDHAQPPVRQSGPNSVPIADIGYFGCRFPVGEAEGADQLFCNEPASGTYCARCRGWAYKPTSKPRRIERLEAIAA